ncbi:protein tyrosine phosphatase [Exiguobacterium antarcticum]|uniref:Tyrosine-protein phosphatase n=1 Tax=Exiguobacterium antarcticum TaxID=132920 RepID=A0ABT6R654_9BACL|nr:CpsB/CapC family capsule biosynthesis tyrosine phosphatase [Exiguobacterium antarcticum]MDI3236262.1 protein tyrosine phosphatase [Exiguobacterium antarcticum]
MVDIHCHLLPLVDDGPSSVEQMLQLAEQAASEGVTRIIATPHLFHPQFETTEVDVQLTVAEVNVLLNQRNIPVVVSPGHEIRLTGNLIEEVRTGVALPLAHSRYLLIEFPSTGIPSYARQVFAELISDGYIPVIAHPEKNKAIIQNPTLLFDLISNGAISQVTCASLIGKYGKDVQRFAIALLENGLAHLVASDAHHTEKRPMYWEQCRKFLAQELEEWLYEEIYENNEAILLNHLVTVNPPNPVEKNWKGQWV